MLTGLIILLRTQSKVVRVRLNFLLNQYQSFIPTFTKFANLVFARRWKINQGAEDISINNKSIMSIMKVLKRGSKAYVLKLVNFIDVTIIVSSNLMPIYSVYFFFQKYQSMMFSVKHLICIMHCLCVNSK